MALPAEVRAFLDWMERVGFSFSEPSIDHCGPEWVKTDDEYVARRYEEFLACNHQWTPFGDSIFCDHCFIQKGSD